MTHSGRPRHGARPGGPVGGPRPPAAPRRIAADAPAARIGGVTEPDPAWFEGGRPAVEAVPQRTTGPLTWPLIAAAVAQVVALGVFAWHLAAMWGRAPRTAHNLATLPPGELQPDRIQLITAALTVLMVVIIVVTVGTLLRRMWARYLLSAVAALGLLLLLPRATVLAGIAGLVTLVLLWVPAAARAFRAPPARRA